LTTKEPRRNAPLAPNGRGRRIRLDDREAVAHGLRPGFWSDLHHHAITARWSHFFVAAALVFVLCNLAFASLYMLGDDPIANARPGHFIDYFFFSIETFATVGYGDMHPRTTYGHSIAAAGAFVGVCSLAMTTGLIFTRFTLPRARVLFARNPVVTLFDGKPTLMIRFANARNNMIVDASAKLWLFRTESSAEGAPYRRFHRLALARDESPMFALSWTIMHAIDSSSPLHGWSAADFRESGVTFVLGFEGHDETSNHLLRARKTYAGADVAYDCEYVDVMSQHPSGPLTIDYARFHEIRPAAHPLA
jgi:inward rectifier potassium channel